MKKVIMILDEDPTYSKKFCNQAIKLLGKKYLFLAFSSIKTAKEYAKENKVESFIVSDIYLDNIDDIKCNSLYILNEKSKNERKEGKRTYVYKIQNIKLILEIIDKEIEKKMSKEIKGSDGSKVVLFYSTETFKNKDIIMKRIAKQLSKKRTVLIVDMDEFSNYKGSVGLSNIIYNYKENNLSIDNIKKEVVIDDEQDYIKSITYPEDFNVVNNIDLANIVNEIKALSYDYIFINSDTSFIKVQYIFNDADKVILMKDKDGEKNDILKSYLKSEKDVDLKKITEYDIEKKDKAYISAFAKQCFDERYE